MPSKPHVFYQAFLALLLFATGSPADVYRPGGNVATLIANMTTAIASPQEDLIDLGGFIYLLQAGPFNDGNGANGLPIINGGGKLSIINGTIKNATTRTGSPIAFRFLQINAGQSLSLFNVTLEFGNDTSIFGGGAILNLGTLDLQDCTLANNQTTLEGGALYSVSSFAYIERSVFLGNSASGAGGGISAFLGSSIFIDSSVFARNTTASNGGGISFYADIISKISNSEISNNISAGQGGGIIVLTDSRITISNSTIANNSSNVGGGIMFDNVPMVSINNCTIAKNSAISLGGGIVTAAATLTSLVSNIIASNTAPMGLGPDFYNLGLSPVVNENYNLLSSAPNGAVLPLNGLNDIIQVNAGTFLGALQDNGGPTFTIALLPGSLAINNGNNLDNLRYDQRGTSYHRVECGVLDIGAFEWQRCSQ